MENLPKTSTPTLKYKTLRKLNTFEIPDITENIESVEAMANKLFNQKISFYKWFYIALYFLWTIFLFFDYPKSPPSDDKLQSYFIFGLLPLLIPIGYYAHIRTQILNAFYEQFAENLGFMFCIIASTEGLDGALFKIGHSQLVTCDILGQIAENHLRLCIFQYTTGSGKHTTIHKSTIFEINFTKPLAPILLVIDRAFFGGLRPQFPNAKKLKLEGSYENIFDLYVPEKMEIEALQIFDIKFLELMKEKYSQFSLEFTGEKAYIYSNGVLTTRLELQNMFSLAKYLAEELEPKLYAMAGSVKAMQELNPKNKNI